MTTPQGSDAVTDVEAALGRMIYRAGQLEAAMRFAGQSLATTEKEHDDLTGVAAGAILTRTQDIAGRSTVVSADRLAELKEIIAEARPALESRNTYVHGIWIDKKGTPTVLNFQKGATVRTRPLTVEDLSALSDTLLDLAKRAINWNDQVMGDKIAELAENGDEEWLGVPTA